jgi:ketosteroid isomerase-like protein
VRLVTRRRAEPGNGAGDSARAPRSALLHAEAPAREDSRRALGARERAQAGDFGTTRDGGPFENAFVAILLTRGDQVQRYEFFDVGDTDRALARFEELCAA